MPIRVALGNGSQHLVKIRVDLEKALGAAVQSTGLGQTQLLSRGYLGESYKWLLKTRHTAQADQPLGVVFICIRWLNGSR